MPTSPLAASLRVPSPPRTITASVPRLAAPWASRVAWPRRLVSATVTSWSAASDFWITTRARAVTDEAEALTMRSSRTGRTGGAALGCSASERNWATLLVSSRDTCICEMPRRRAISDWVRPSKKRSCTTWR